MSRRFSKETKVEALKRAGHQCQICGHPDVDCYYIYSKKLKSNWARIGGHPETWMNDYFIRSLNNCVVLCPDCSDLTHSKKGLKEVTVQYLESLNSEPERCTLRHPEGRCRNQIAVEGCRRCQNHLDY